MERSIGVGHIHEILVFTILVGVVIWIHFIGKGIVADPLLCEAFKFHFVPGLAHKFVLEECSVKNSPTIEASIIPLHVIEKCVVHGWIVEGEVRCLIFWFIFETNWIASNESAVLEDRISKLCIFECSVNKDGVDKFDSKGKVSIGIPLKVNIFKNCIDKSNVSAIEVGKGDIFKCVTLKYVVEQVVVVKGRIANCGFKWIHVRIGGWLHICTKKL